MRRGVEPERATVYVSAETHSSMEKAVRIAGLGSDVRIALTHYSPVRDTLRGEPPEIYPFLGSYLLAEVIDGAGVAVAIHGHAHRGREHGTTDGGVPVRNVAEPVIGVPYRVYGVGGSS